MALFKSYSTSTIGYYQRFRDVIEADIAEELALSEELAHRDSPQS